MTFDFKVLGVICELYCNLHTIIMQLLYQIWRRYVKKKAKIALQVVDQV